MSAVDLVRPLKTTTHRPFPGETRTRTRPSVSFREKLVSVSARPKSTLTQNSPRIIHTLRITQNGGGGVFGGGLFTRDDGLVRGARGLAHPTPHSSSTNNIANLYGAAGDGRNAGPPGSGASAADRLTAAFGAIGVADRDELPSRSATAPLLPFENGGFGNHRAATRRR
jgi:hypothetical protein